MNGGDDEFGGERGVLVVHLFDAAVVGFEDAVFEVFESAQCSLQRLLGQCVEQVLESFLGARVDGCDLLRWARGLLVRKHGADERQGQYDQSAE